MIISISVFIFIAVYFILPLVLPLFVKGVPKSKMPLVIAAVLYFISWFLPSPLIEGQNTFFITHLVGGGIFTGFVWLYIKNFYNLKISPLAEIILLYLLVSALGVTNELFEFVFTKLGIFSVNPFDTWWDLLANTLGAVIFWIGYRAYLIFKKNPVA